jgi:DNA-binding winged helix-turn-helix (wHTH) protein/Tol biopolymer transport system component
MAKSVSTTQIWRFGIFEVDAQREQLRRAGIPIKLRQQSFRILVLLLEHAGDPVTREELRKALWPDDTYVDFDHSLNSALMKLREALGDAADKPLYIETVPKRGYRFIAPLVAAESAEASDDPPPARPMPLSRLSLHKPMISLCVLAAITATIWYLRRPLPPPRITDYMQLTNDGRPKRIAGTDGTDLFVNFIQPGTNFMLPVTGGGRKELVIDFPVATRSHGSTPYIIAVSTDESRLLVGSDWDDTSGRSIWVVGIHGLTARYLVKGDDAAWSPDNKTVVYSNLKGDLYTIPSQGGDSKLLLAASGGSTVTDFRHDLCWSPDGTRIRFVRQGRYWEVAADGTNAHELLPDWHAADPRYLISGGQWSPYGRLFLFTAWSGATSLIPNFAQNLGSEIWAIDERKSDLNRANREPIQLTSGPVSWGTGGLAFSRDGTKVYTTGIISRGELVIFDPKSHELNPFLEGISAEFVDFSRDGKQLVYVTYPEGVMWRANRDGTGLIQLTNPPLYPVEPRWSPDGKQIVFSNGSGFEQVAIYTIPSQGGTPKRLLPGGPILQLDSNWSPDGKKIVFTETAGAAMTGAKQANRILELGSGKIFELPHSPRSFFSPRWSPDGRYIAGITTDHRALELIDLEKKQSSTIELGEKVPANWISWSHDSRFIYYLNVDDYVLHTRDPGVYRVSITEGRLEKVVDLNGFTPAGFGGMWLGIDPDDTPILLRNAGMREIYALTLGGVRDHVK